MRRLRRLESNAIGWLILIAVVIGIFGWIKDNVVDYTQPSFWIAVAIVTVIVLAIKARQAAVRRARDAIELAERVKARQEYIEWGVKRAVEIAAHQKWVSASRLSRQAHLTETQARDLIAIAVSASLLYQAVNGKFYSRALLGHDGAPPAVSE